MPASYSYIDVATLDAVRQRFAAADALTILSADLDQIIWANGPGAELFGYGDIGTALGAPSRLGFAAKRQIAATGGFPDIGKDRAIGVRLTTGMTSRVAALLATSIVLPDGEKAILLAAPAPQTTSPDRGDLARRAIGGFAEPGQFTALLGAGGAVEAASAGFERLGITGQTLARLVADTQGERDRTVRRAVEAGGRALPAGLARLSDDPARYLLVVIDEGADEDEAVAEPAPEPIAGAQAATDTGAVETSPTASEATAPATDMNGGAIDSLVEFADDEEGFEETAALTPPGNRPAEQDTRPHQHDEWYFSGDEEAAAPAGKVPEDRAAEAGDDHAAAEQAARPVIDKAAAPVRFVWRTDADGRFSTISPEFAAAVGAAAADVVGKSFGEVAAAFKLDPDGEIASLLERRDTWSGRSVLWPVADTDLKVPVDLAALPAYSRDRKFEGFRGFGVARTGDAIVDAEAVGLNLAGAFAAFAEPEPASETTIEPMQAEAPVETKPIVEEPAAAKPTDAKSPTADAGKPGDPFKGEVPVLSIVPKPDRRFTDKVIRLAEHRAPANDKSLSSVERNAFREIGERLRKDSAPGQAGETPAPAAGTSAGVADAVAAPQDVTANVEDVSTSAEVTAPLAESTATSADTALQEGGTVQAEASTNEAESDETAVSTDDELSDAPVKDQSSVDDVAAPVEDDESVLVHEGSDAETLDDLAALDGVEAAEAVSDVAVVADIGDEDATSEPASGTEEPSATIGETTHQIDDVDAHATRDDGMAAAENQPAEVASEAAAGPVESAPARPRRGSSLLDFMERRPAASSREADAAATQPERPVAAATQVDLQPPAFNGQDDEDAETAAYAEAETAQHEAETQAEDATTEPSSTLPDNVATVEAGGSVASEEPVAADGEAIADEVSSDTTAEEPALEAANLPERSDDYSGHPTSSGPADETYHIEAVVLEASGSTGDAIVGHTHLHADNDESFVPAGEGDDASTLAAIDDVANSDEIELASPTHGENAERSEDGDDSEFAADADGVEADAAKTPHRAGADTSILDKLPVPVLIHAGDTLHHANAEFLALTGYDDIEALAADGGLGRLFATSDEDHVDGSDRQMRLTRSDGSDVPVDAHLRSVPWGGGKALMLVVTPRPGEAREAVALPNQPAVADLQARVAEMRTIIDTATDGVVLIGRDGTIRSISRPAEALFGFDSDEVAGKPFASLFAIESQRAARDYLNGLSEHGVASVLNDGREVIGRESQGRFIPLFMTIGRLPGDSGYCAVVRDITQWKRAEEELTQARAMAERASSQKSDFLARVSHEIRTPLNAIIGFSELMIDEKFGPVANDRYRDYLRDINRSGNHVLDLVNDLLDISKIEAGQQEMSYEAVSLNDTLAETVAMMQPQANRERVIIRSSFASRLPEVVADLRSVRQIALNILSNAVRYTQAGGQVIVSTAYEASGDVVMRVRDTGIGMSHAEIEQALKPFKQINALKRGRNDGTGLGLPLTKAMVEANRAKFSILSTPGEGTLVEITFPSTRVLAE